MVTSTIGSSKTTPLKPNGENIMVTNENRKGNSNVFVETKLIVFLAYHVIGNDNNESIYIALFQSRTAQSTLQP